MKSTLIYATMAITLSPSVLACTTILVGNQATTDGSYIIARNADHSPLVNQIGRASCRERVCLYV